MPLGYFREGAQLSETVPWRTGSEFDAGVGAGIQQTGGFVPSVMGGFVTAGARLAPLAAYMSYRQRNGYRAKK